MSCSVEQDPPLLRLRLIPPFVVSDVAETLQDALPHRANGGGPELLIVVEGNQSTSATEMRRMAKLLGDLREKIGRRIAVAAPSDLSYGLFRMFGVFAGTAGLDVAVFRQTGQAEEWLRRRRVDDHAAPNGTGGA